MERKRDNKGRFIKENKGNGSSFYGLDVKITRGVYNGKERFALTIKYRNREYTLRSENNNLTGDISNLSKDLTNTRLSFSDITKWYSLGIFDIVERENATVTFWVGDFKKDFKFFRLSYMNDNLEDIKVELKKRIEMVRAWVQSVDYEEVLQFTL